MHNLIYLSAASYLLSNDEPIEILNRSRVNNTRLDVTGLLLYHEGSILQILEGEKETVHALFDKIKSDTRHKGVIKIIDNSITEKSFGNWSMGFKQITGQDWSLLSGYLNLDNKEDFPSTNNAGSSNIINIIKSFAEVNMRN